MYIGQNAHKHNKLMKHKYEVVWVCHWMGDDDYPEGAGVVITCDSNEELLTALKENLKSNGDSLDGKMSSCRICSDDNTNEKWTPDQVVEHIINECHYVSTPMSYFYTENQID
jgi:hypothetical protein